MRSESLGGGDDAEVWAGGDGGGGVEGSIVVR